MARATAWAIAGVLGWFAISSCGDDGGDGGPAGAPAPPPELGERCVSQCASGVCERGGRFAGLCVADCTNDASCQLLLPDLRCAESKCVLQCQAITDCPSNTACTPFGSRSLCVPVN